MKHNHRVRYATFAATLATVISAGSLGVPVGAAGGGSTTPTHPTDPNVSTGNVAM